MRKTYAFPLWPVLGFCAYSLLYFPLLYHPGLVRLDDFGYLQSVAETLVRHRPFTHDSLEPYGATMSVLGALIYAVTGDFPFATWGLQALFAGANFFLLYALIRPRLGPRGASLSALLLATQPIYWYKCAEYTGNVFTMAFVLAALLAYRRGRWGWFFPLVFLAFANRQNSVAMLALPAFQLAFDRTMPASVKARLWIGVAAFVAAGLGLHAIMNHTVAQAQNIYAVLDARKCLLIVRAGFIGLCLGLAWLSCLGLLLGKNALANLRANLSRPWLPLAATCGFLALLLPSSLPHLRSHPYVEFCAPLLLDLDARIHLQWFLAALVPGLLWALDWRAASRPTPAMALFLGYVAVSGLRAFWYDFYLIDLALAALFLLLEDGGALRPVRIAPLLAGFILLAHIAWGYGFKILADKEMLSLRSYEGMERDRGLPVDRMTGAPWGYLGWKLYDHLVSHSDTDARKSFGCYMLADQVVVETQLPWRRSYKRSVLPPQALILEAGKTPIGGFPVPYRVLDLRRAGSPPGDPACYLSLEGAQYRSKPFPLDAAEWSAYIRERRRNYGSGTGTGASLPRPASPF